ncbi:transmembrane emp24 domain-containing protein p24delta9-like [Primulina huaijiensis]|uniref:transmembrane emp24 domain-containing protein p24delta9-like n=1 Tax=Primulina huaijiensis TaxID=1492673 RepID=UPI003CC7225C
MHIQIQIQKKSLLLVLILVFCISVESIRFDLESGHTKCIAEDIKSNSMTVGKYHVVNPSEGHPLPDSHKITVRVTSSYGNSYHYSDHVHEGSFAFQATEAGDYMSCFFAADNKPSTTITVDFDWKSGVAAKDWTNVAKKGSIESMELELKKMFDTVQSIHDEMFFLREREEEMQELNRSTNSKMAWLSILSLFICSSVAGLQLWHLKSFFEKKKLI